MDSDLKSNNMPCSADRRPPGPLFSGSSTVPADLLERCCRYQGEWGSANLDLIKGEMA